MGFVTRMFESGVANTTSEDAGQEQVLLGGPRRPMKARRLDDETALRRSFRVMDLVCNPTKSFDSLVASKMNTITCALCDIFRCTSDGNFYHFEKIADHMLRNHGTEFFRQALVGHQLALRMLYYMDEPPVGESLVKIMFCRVPPAAKRALFQKLLDANFLGIIFERVTDPRMCLLLPCRLSLLLTLAVTQTATPLRLLTFY